MSRWQVGSFTMAQMGQSKSVIGEFMKQKRKVCPFIVTHPTRCLAVCENRGHNWHHQCGHEREGLRHRGPWTDGHWPEIGSWGQAVGAVHGSGAGLGFVPSAAGSGGFVIFGGRESACRDRHKLC
ncbi:MAG: hypothetical protein ACPIOQ_60560 [Promethearchaeia archaeon]